MKRMIIAICLSTLFCLGIVGGQEEQAWYKGNTHTHTVNSDGDSTPDEVARWYKEHGYHFLVLSDHNFLTEVSGLNTIFGAREKFLLIAGEEVTDSFEQKLIHINGLNIPTMIAPQHGSSVVETLQNNIDAIRQHKGVPHINHPNFRWSLTAKDIQQLKNNKLFEIYNGHPSTQDWGGGGSDSLEAMWDKILSSGKLIYGIAVDDAHHFKGEFAPGRSNPGRGWVAVRANQLSPLAIMEGLETGQFYASTGVSLADVRVDSDGIEITIQEKPYFKYTTYFIGDGGRLLSKAYGLKVRYQFDGSEKYVRSRIVDSLGDIAWTQPVLVSQAR